MDSTAQATSRGWDSLAAKAGLLLSLAGVAITSYLTYQHQVGGNPACVILKGCDVVNQSTYASLWGVPTAGYGLAMYLALAALFGLRPLSPSSANPSFRYASLGITLVGVGISALLTYIEVAVLHALCIWCLISAGIVTLLFVLAATDVARHMPGKARLAPDSGAEEAG